MTAGPDRVETRVGRALSTDGGYRVAAGALLVLTAALYAPLAGAEFAWDDAALVVDNRLTGDLANWREILRTDLWTTTRLPAPPSGYHRPLFLLMLAVERALFGLSAIAHHLVSIGFHLGASAAVAVLLRRLLPPLPALAGLALFALHPVQSEVVALIAARNDSMAALFLVLSLVLSLQRHPGALRLVGAALAAFAAFASKESTLLAPLFLLGLDLARWGRPRGVGRYLALAVALLAYGGLRAWAGVGAAALPEPGNWELVARVIPELLGAYGSLLVWPWPLTPARHVHYLPRLGSTLLGLVLLVLLLVTAVRVARRRRLVLVGLGWALLAFLPTLAATLDKGLLGDRYLYLPMLGLALVLGAAIPTHDRVWRYGAGLVAAAAVAIAVRVPDWQNSRALWTAAHEDAPSPFTAAGLGWYLNHEGDAEDALPLIVEALRGTPPYRDACPLLVSIPLGLDRPEETVRLGRWALQAGICAPTGLFLGPYALGLAGTGQWDRAMAVAQRPELDGPGPGWVVLAAGMLRQGNASPLRQYTAQWQGSSSFPAQVARLLKLSGQEELARRVLASTAVR